MPKLSNYWLTRVQTLKQKKKSIAHFKYQRNQFTPLFIAVKFDNIENVKTLIKKGANIEAKEK